MQAYPSGIGGVGLLEGHLEMKTKRWKCYFVQLLGRQLFLFHDFNANPTQIHIHESATCKMGKSKRNNYQFSLHMGKTTHHFRAPSELHRATWMMHILEASKSVSPKRQASQRSVYSISSLSSLGSLGRYPDDLFIGAPSEYVQFCRRSRGTRSTDSSPTPTEMDLGTRSLFGRRSLADCHLPLNNMRWYESAPPTPVPLMTPVPCMSEENIDSDIISLPDISTALHRQQKPKQHLQRAGGMNNLETLDALSQGDKFQDLSSLDFTEPSDTSQLDSYANFLQWPFYNPASIDLLDTSLLELVRPPKFHRSTSLPHSLAKFSRDTNAPLQWINTRTQPALSVLSEKNTPDTSTPQLSPVNYHSSLDRNNSILDTNMPRLTLWPGNMELYVPPDTNTEPKAGTNGCHSVTPGYSTMQISLPPDYENVDTLPPLLPKRTRTVPGNLIEVSKHMNISEPELFPRPISCLKRSILRSISRQDAEDILRGMAVGTFLVRFRESSPDKLALSIHMEDGILHHRINSDTYGAYSIEGFDCCENSLEALLRAFIRARNNQLRLFCPEEPLSDEDAHEWESNNSLDFIL